MERHTLNPMRINTSRYELGQLAFSIYQSVYDKAKNVFYDSVR